MICPVCGDDHIDMEVCACGCTHTPATGITLSESAAWIVALESWIERRGLTVPTWATVNE